MQAVIQNATGRIDPLIHPIVRTLGILAMPAAALALVHWLTASGANLPSHLLGLKLYGPYVPLSLAGFLSVWFNCGRAFPALLCLLSPV